MTAKSSAKTNSVEATFRKRVMWVASFLLIGFLAITIRLVHLQIVQGDKYQAQASNQRTSVQRLFPVRGEIKISDYFAGEAYTVATSIEKPLVYVVPADIEDPEKIAEQLASVLQLDKQFVWDKIKDPSRKYVQIKKQITEEERQAVEALKLRGVSFDAETTRFYPEGEFMGPVLGFVGYKGDERVGLYGVESMFEKDLKGIPGSLAQEKDNTGSWIFGAKRDRVPAVDGDNIILTIDKTIQLKAESIIKETVEEHSADSGSVVIMDPKTGAILAMANYPSFDPNNYSKVEDISYYNNQITMGGYEPGSIFKPITVAAAVNEGKIRADTPFFDSGEVKIDGYTIKNSEQKVYGQQDINFVLQESLNTGTIFAKDKIGNKKFGEYLQRFGFGKKTGIEVPESAGNLSNLVGNIGVNYHTASFGQGISVTPIQMVQSFGALANGGKMMQPYMVKSRIRVTGEVIETKPEQLGQPITSQTASTVSGMLVNVVEKGHGKRAAVPGYYVGGKTGTAQVARKDGRGYEENNNIGSFIGYAPIEDPKFVMLVRVNHPRTVRFAESTAAPAFGKIAQFLLNYYKVAPNRDVSAQ